MADIARIQPMDDFSRALAFVWRPANDGQPYHVTPGDRGGATAWGVTAAIFNAWMEQHQLQCTSTLAGAKRATLGLILQTWFWKPCGAGLPRGVNLMVFDFCVTSGQRNAAELLQRTVGASIDGDIGPLTIRAAAAMDPASLCRLLHARRAAFYDAIHGHEQDEGWYRRNDACLAEALAMIAADQAAA